MGRRNKPKRQKDAVQRNKPLPPDVPLRPPGFEPTEKQKAALQALIEIPESRTDRQVLADLSGCTRATADRWMKDVDFRNWLADEISKYCSTQLPTTELYLHDIAGSPDAKDRDRIDAIKALMQWGTQHRRDASKAFAQVVESMKSVSPGIEMAAKDAEGNMVAVKHSQTLNEGARVGALDGTPLRQPEVEERIRQIVEGEDIEDAEVVEGDGA